MKVKVSIMNTSTHVFKKIGFREKKCTHILFKIVHLKYVQMCPIKCYYKAPSIVIVTYTLRDIKV